KRGRSGVKVLAKPAPTPKVTNTSGPRQQSAAPSAPPTAPREASQTLAPLGRSCVSGAGSGRGRAAVRLLRVLEDTGEGSLQALQGFFALTALHARHDAGFHVGLEEIRCHSVNRLLERGDLHEDVVTALVLCQH